MKQNSHTVEKPIYSPFADIREFTAFDYLFLKRINSPLYHNILLRKEEDCIQLSEEDQAELIFQFTRPAKEIKRIFEQEGRDGFRKIATETIWFDESFPLPPLCAQIALVQIIQNFGAPYFI